jgi:hypothetical protein
MGVELISETKTNARYINARHGRIKRKLDKILCVLFGGSVGGALGWHLYNLYATASRVVRVDSLYVWSGDRCKLAEEIIIDGLKIIIPVGIQGKISVDPFGSPVGGYELTNADLLVYHYLIKVPLIPVAIGGIIGLSAVCGYLLGKKLMKRYKVEK